MPEYQRYRAEVERCVQEVNRRFGRPGWTPVRLLVLDDHPRALRALAAADVVVVNPVWDGMNLVAKEAACVNDRDAVLILSRNAGVALPPSAWFAAQREALSEAAAAGQEHRACGPKLRA